MATIDELSIEIESNSKKANKDIDALSKSLLNLQKSVKGLGSIKLDGFKNVMKSISDSAKSLSGIKELSDTVKSLQKLSNVSSAAKSLEKVKKSADGLKDIDVDIDKKAFKTLRELQEKFRDLGKNFKFSGSTDAIQKEIERYSNSLEKAKLKKEDLEAAEKTKGKTYENAVRDVIKYKNVLESLGKQLEKAKEEEKSLSKTEINPKIGTIATDKLKEFQNALKHLEVPEVHEENLEKLNKSLENAEEKLGKLKANLKNGLVLGEISENVNDNAFKKLQKQITLTEKEVEALQKQISKISETSLESATVEIKETTESLKESKLIAKKLDETLKNIEPNIDTKDFETAVDELQERFKDVGTDFSFKGDSTQLEKTIKNLDDSLDKLYEKQDEMRDLGVDFDSRGFVKLQRDIALTTNKLKILNSQMEKVKKASSELSKSFTIQRNESTASNIDTSKPQTRTVSAQSFGYDAGAMEAVFGEGAKGIRDYNDAIKKLGDSAATVLNGMETDFEEAGKSVKKAAESVSDIGDKIGKNFKDAELSVDEFEDYLENLEIPEIRTDNLKKLQSELAQTEKKLDELTAKSDNWASKGINPDSKQFRNLQEQIVATSKKSDALKKKIKEVGETKPNVSGWQKLTAVATLIDKSFSAIKRGVSSALSSIKKLGNGFKSLQSVVKKVSSTIGKLFSNIVQLAGKATTAITSSVKGISSAFSKLSGGNSGLQTATSGLGKIAKAAAGLVAAGGLISFGKQATELGSDITEVENVVDTAFGSMANKVYDFASTAAEKFGLSEYAAKQYSGTMMAMLKSSGVAQDAAADMSITLAGLAGDIASFYNIDTEHAFKKLRSGIAGQTAPLKQLGINLNVANLEAYAMSQGIRKSYNEMTLAEQTILRYNYILAKTGDAQSDFARTAGTWANQLRLLRLNIQSISAIIGQGLIAALLPAIQLLNKFMSKLTEAAKKFRDFMYVLFGKKIESPMRGVVDDMADMVDYNTDLSGISDSTEDIEDGMEDAADGTDDFTSSAKKLQKQLGLLSFDELNQLPGMLDDLGASKTKKDKLDDLGLDDLGIGNLDDAFDDLLDKQSIEPVNEWARRIREAFLNHDWEGLGKVIAELVNVGLKKLYDFIKDITPKVERAMRALAKVINSFVKWLDWDLLGRTIGAGINLLTRAFNALFGPGGIDLEQLGRKLSVGLRGMIDEVDWRGLGNAIGNYFMIAWRIASGFVEDMWRINPDTLLTGWAEVGIALAEAVNGIFERINFAQIGKTISDGFDGIVEIIRNFREQMVSNGTWSMIATSISDGLNNIIDTINLVGAAEQISGLVLDIFDMLNDAAERTHWNEFGYKVSEALFAIPWLQLFNDVFDLVSATFGEALGGFVNYLTTHAEQLGQSFADVFNTIFEKIKYIASNIPWNEIGEAISTFLNTAIAKIRPGQAAVSLGNFVTSLLGTMLQVAQNTDWTALGRKIGIFLQTIPWSTIIGQVFDTITTIFRGLITGLGGKIVDMMPTIGTSLASGFNHAFETLKEFVASVQWTDIGHNIATGLNNMIHGINWKEAGETFGSFVKGVIDTIFTVAMETDWKAFGEGIGDFLDGIPWLEILGKVGATIANVVGEVIAGLFETTSGKFILGFAGLKLLLKGINLGNTALEIANDFAHKFGLLPDGINLTIPKVVEGVENLSGKFSPIISTVKDVVTKVGEKFGFLPNAVTDTIPAISGGVETIAGGTGLFSKILTGATGLVSKIGPVLGSIGSVIFSPTGLLIGGIAIGVGLIIANWDSVKKAAGEIWGAVKTAVTDTWEGLKTAAADIWGGITTFLSDTWDGLKTAAGDIWNGTKTVISDTWDGLTTVAHDTWDALSTYLKDTWDGLKNVASDVWGGITTGISDIWGGLKTVAGDVWGAITGKVSDANSDAQSNTSTSWAVTQENLNASLQTMTTAVTNAMAAIKAAVSVSMAEISATYISGWQTIAGASSVVLQQVQSEVTMMMQTIKGIIMVSMQEIGAIFNSGWQAVATISLAAIQQINAVVTSSMMAMQAMIGTSMQQIVSIFTSTWTAIGTLSVAATSKMQADVTAKMQSILNTVSNTMKSIQNAYSAGWKAAENATSSSLTAINNTVSSKMNAIKNAIASAMTSIQNTFKSKWTEIGNTVTQLLNQIQSTVNSKMNDIKNKIASSMNDIYNTFKSKWESIGNTCKNALSQMQSTVTEKMNAIKITVSNSMNSIVSSYQNGLNKFPTITSNVLGNVVREFQSLPNKIGAAINNNMVTAGHNAAVSFANGFMGVRIPTPHLRVASWTQHTSGETTYSTPNYEVNWYKKGGLAYNPSVVGIGEAGPEAILPLENKKTMGMIAESILESSYSSGGKGFGISQEELSEAVEEAIVYALMNNIENLTPTVNCYAELKTEDNEVLARAVARGQESIDYRTKPTPRMAY